MAKYRAKPTNGYASKWESRVAEQVRSELRPGEEMLEQVAIKFACGAKYVVDFAVARHGAIVRYIEAKGIATPVWRLKMRMLRHEFPEIAAALDVRYQRPPRKRKKRKAQ